MPSIRQLVDNLLAKHGQVSLANDKGEDEVDADSDGLPSSTGLNVVELRGHQPTQGTPGPGKPSSEEALKGQNGACRVGGDVASDLVEAATHDTRHHHKADEHLNPSLNQQSLTAKPAFTYFVSPQQHVCVHSGIQSCIPCIHTCIMAKHILIHNEIHTVTGVCATVPTASDVSVCI